MSLIVVVLSVPGNDCVEEIQPRIVGTENSAGGGGVTSVIVGDGDTTQPYLAVFIIHYATYVGVGSAEAFVNITVDSAIRDRQRASRVPNTSTAELKIDHTIGGFVKYQVAVDCAIYNLYKPS